MFVVDANLLIYAHNRSSHLGASGKAWLEAVLSGVEPVGLPWAVVHAFLRLTTGKVVLPRPLDMETALSIVEDWMRAPTTRIVEPGARY